MTIILQPAKTAPQDGSQIIGDFGFPWLQVAAWCPRSEKWAVANMQAQTGDPEGLDVWFETEYEKPSELRGWIPMPPLPRRKARKAAPKLRALKTEN